MITNFALSLSFDGIELLHRVPRGWRRIGRADVASETLDADLAHLREKAEAIEPDGLRTKLIIPLDQIKYIALDGTMTTQQHINDALDGETPYALNELVIDSEKFGGRTHIAAVARETLKEAEAFAAAHGFQPVAFVAVPEPFTFQKEVFFGPTDMARQVVSPDALIERDDMPVMVVGTRIKSRLLIFDLPKEVEEDVYKDDLAELLARQDEPSEPAQVAETAHQVDPPIAEAEAEAIAILEVAAQDEPQAQAIWVDPVPAEYYAPAPNAAAPTRGPLIPAAPVFATLALLDPIMAEFHPSLHKRTKAPLVAIGGAGSSNAPKLVAAPAANRSDVPKEKRNKPALIAASIAVAAVVLGGWIWSQNETTDTAVIPVAEPVEVAVAAPETPTPVEILSAPTLEPGLEIPQSFIEALNAPQTTADYVSDVRNQDTIPDKTSPFAIAVSRADDGLSTVQPPPAPPAEETAVASLGVPVLRGQVLSPDEAGRIYEATGVWQRAPRFLDVPSRGFVFEFRTPDTVLRPSRIAQPSVPPLTGLDTDLSFVAPANPPAPEVTFPRDANGFILATAEGTLTPDGALVIAGLPDLSITPRPELSQADIDRMTLLAPAPEGVVIVAGRPDFATPLRPANAALPDTETTSEAVVDAAPVTDTPSPGGVGLAALELQGSGAIALDAAVVEDRALLDLRPQLRPQGLSPAVDPGTPDITDILAGIETDDATLRFDNSTALAVVLSQRPNARPGNFDNVVAAAAQRATRPAAPTTTPTAPVVAAAPVPPQNTGPVPGGVARAATQEDAISLRQINLIGVYGRANARRALVRLSNGRFVRVEVGSALDGGQVTAIGEDALNYVKRGRTYALELPSG